MSESLVESPGRELDPKPGDWGTVPDGGRGPQANAWTVRLRNLGNVADACWCESAYPARSDAPETATGGAGVRSVALGGVGLGMVAAAVARALRDQIIVRPGGPPEPAPGAVFAEAGTASCDIGVPYIGSPTGGTQMSPIGVHLDASWVSATSRAGRPVRFGGGLGRGYVSSFGKRIADIPSDPGVGYTVRVPADRAQAPMAWFIFNEHVTTDARGNPTLGADGRYKPDPNAEHGFINAVRILVLGAKTAGVTIGHAATLSGPT